MWALLLSLSTALSGLQSVSATDRPSVLFIAIDDLNNWGPGLTPESAAQTPHLDRLAQQGVLFTNAHCAAPACNPSRVSVMTSVSPSTSGVYYNWQDWRRCQNLRDVPVLPQHFRDHGYKVLGGGKLYHAANLSQWGLRGFLDASPFDEYFPSRDRQIADELVEPGNAVNGSNKFYRGRFDWLPTETTDEETGDGKVVTWAVSQLEQTHDRPLFLAVGLYRPHIPWYTPKKWFDHYPLDQIQLPKVQENDLDDVPKAGVANCRQEWHRWMLEQGKWKEAVQAYLASVSFADAMVGRLIQAVEQSPAAESTIIVVWSDHGYHLGHKEHWEKFALWEQTTQVPLIISAPAYKTTHGSQCGAPVSLLDIYPTLADLAGLPTPQHAEGVSLSALLRNPQAISDRAVVTTQGMGNHAVRDKRFRYILYADGGEELYDHESDPHEFRNIVEQQQHRQTVVRLRQQLPECNAGLLPPDRNADHGK